MHESISADSAWGLLLLVSHMKEIIVTGRKKTSEEANRNLILFVDASTAQRCSSCSLGRHLRYITDARFTLSLDSVRVSFLISLLLHPYLVALSLSFLLCAALVVLHLEFNGIYIKHLLVTEYFVGMN